MKASVNLSSSGLNYEAPNEGNNIACGEVKQY